MVDTFAGCPPMNTIASSTPRKRAISPSSAAWIGRSPDTTRLAETELPQRATASCAAWVTSGSPESPR